MSLEIWGYILGGAAIFALIRGLFSLYMWWTDKKGLTKLIEKPKQL